MDCTGACFSAAGESITGRLTNTTNVGAMEILQGESATALIVNQKLDRLLQVAATQAEELRVAKAASETSQGQLRELNQKVASLEHQLAANCSQTISRMANFKLPRSISVSALLYCCWII